MKKYLIILALGTSFCFSVFATDEQVLKGIYNTSGKELSIPLNIKSIYIYFWATWCSECVRSLKKDLSYIKNLDEKFIVALSTEKNSKRVKYFKKKYSISRELYIEPNRQLIKALDVKEVPLWTKWKRSGGKWILEKKQLGKLEE